MLIHTERERDRKGSVGPGFAEILKYLATSSIYLREMKTAVYTKPSACMVIAAFFILAQK